VKRKKNEIIEEGAWIVFFGLCVKISAAKNFNNKHFAKFL
jgi:hypothetical protein